MSIKNKILIALASFIIASAPHSGVAHTPRKPQVRTPSKPSAKVSSHSTKMTLSAYTPHRRKHKKVHLTATMKDPIVGWTVAVSRDKKHLLGRTVWVDGIGTRKVTDLMGRQWRNKMDILVASKKEAKEFGLKKKVMVIVL